MKYFITAIGTDVGKTVCASIVCEHLKADYWKPIQCGTSPTDSEVVKSLISNSITCIHTESYKFEQPVSPHHAAELSHVDISLQSIILPATTNDLVIEGAGGVMVPIDYESYTMADVIAKCSAKVIIISKNYLGSINHTLLTINELRRKNIDIKGIVYNGEPNTATERVITKMTGIEMLFRILPEPVINKEVIAKYAAGIKL
ncbi:MAG: dethiobiotin synthase [Cytophagales bacterium]|nr:dethiobiotin synthase [Cytophagales bacterium]